MTDNPFAAEIEKRRTQRLLQGYEAMRSLDVQRTYDVLDAMLHTIDGLREAVKQMNAVLVELKRHAEPKVVAMPARALRHGSPQ